MGQRQFCVRPFTYTDAHEAGFGDDDTLGDVSQGD